MASKTTQQELIGKLRARLKKDAEDWLRDHLPDKGAYISQNADIGTSPLSPSEFLRVRQIYDWERRKDFNQDSSPEVTVSSSFNTTLLSEIVEENDRLVILGEPGLGKSTVLRHLMYEYATQNDKPLPLLIELKNYRHENNRLEGHINSCYKINIDKLKTQNIIFLLDGFNELPHREQIELYIDLDVILSDFSKSRFIVTSRKVSYPEDLRDWSTCEVLEIGKDRILGYLKFLLGKKDSDKLYKKIKDKGLLPISSNPLFLSFIVRLYQTGKQLPNTKGELLNIIFRHDYLKEFSERKKIRSDFSTHLRELGDSRCLKIMSRVAHEVLLETDGVSFDEDFLYNILGEEIGKYAFNIVDLFNQIRLIEKFEVESNDGTKTIYSFWHQVFFEYFAGLYLKNLFEGTPQKSLQQKSLLYFEFFKWDEPMKVAFSLCSDDTANALFSAALETDFFLSFVYFSVVEEKVSEIVLSKFEETLTSSVKDLKSNYATSTFYCIMKYGYQSVFLCNYINRLMEEILRNFVKKEGKFLRGSIPSNSLLLAFCFCNTGSSYSNLAIQRLINIINIIRERFPTDREEERETINLICTFSKTLGIVGGNEAVNYLLCLLGEITLVEVRQTIGEGLLRHEVKLSFSSIKAFLYDKGISVRLVAVKALLESNSDEAHMLFLEHLDAIIETGFYMKKFPIMINYLGSLKTQLSNSRLVFLEKKLLNNIQYGKGHMQPLSVLFLASIFGMSSLDKIRFYFDRLSIKSRLYFLSFWEPKDDSFVVPSLLNIFNEAPSLRKEVVDLLFTIETPGVLIFFKSYVHGKYSEYIRSLGWFDYIVNTMVVKLARTNDPVALNIYIDLKAGFWSLNNHFGPTIKNSFDNILDSSLKNKMAGIFCEARKQIHAGKSNRFHSYFPLCNSMRRRFLYVEPLEDEPDETVKALPPAEQGIVGTKEINDYARVWTKETDAEGKLLNEKGFNDYLEDRRNFEILIVDRGEFDAKAVGAVFLEGRPFSSKAEQLVDPMSSTYTSKSPSSEKYLGRKKILYRILLYTLMNKGCPKEVELIKACWGDPIEKLKKEYDDSKRGSDEYYNLTNKYRRAIRRTNELLQNIQRKDVQITKEDELFLLPRGISFCLLKTL